MVELAGDEDDDGWEAWRGAMMHHVLAKNISEGLVRWRFLRVAMMVSEVA